MKSSTGRFRWLMITLFIVLMAACLGFSMFFMACKGGDSTENPPASSEENPDDGGEEKETTVESVVLSSSELSLTVGGSTEITVTVTMKEGYETVDFTYAVDANGIITVTKEGDKLTVKADAAGTATITVTADGVSATCKVMVSAASSGETEYELVTTDFPYDDFASYYEENDYTVGSNDTSSDVVFGKYTVTSGVRLEGSSGSHRINLRSSQGIIIELGGSYNPETEKEGNSISFTFTSGSSDKDSVLTVSVLGEDGNYTALEGQTWTIVNSDKTQTYPTSYEIIIDDLPAGTYKISGTNSTRIANLSITEYLELSDIEGISARLTTTDFLMGRDLKESSLGMVVTLEYANGKTETVTSGVSTDISTITPKLGENVLTVTYTTDAGEWGTEVSFWLYEITGIEISDFSMEYTSGVYYTNNVQKIYLVGDTISYAYAAVTATASYTDTIGTHEATFILASSEVNFSTADSTGNAITGAFSDAGTYTVTATVDASLKTGDAVTESYEINVVTSEGADATQVKVDQNATLGMDASTGVYTVNTINDAIQLIKLLGAPDDVRKTVTIGAGQYWEKIYID